MSATGNAMLTIQTLLEEVGLKLLTGESSADRGVRWVHSTELLDPTPWLSGGELVLTTGIRLSTPTLQREFIARIVGHGLAGLGFGTGFDHARIPPAVIDAASREAFPVFEVPYEVPFIAVTERAAAHLVNDRYDALRRSSALQAQLERLVLEGRGLEHVVQSVSQAIGTAIVVLDAHGEVLASHGEGLDARTLGGLREAVLYPGVHRPDATSPAPLLLAVAQGARPAPQAWLAAVPGARPPSDLDRLILGQTVTVVALELMRRRIERDTERRLAGDVLAEALTGRLAPEEVQARLEPFGIGERAAVLVYALEDPGAAAPALDDALAQADVGRLVAARGTLLCAVIDASGAEPVALAGAIRRRLSTEFGAVRAAASRPALASALRHSFHEARCALEAVRLANGSAPEVASHRDLGAFQLLLSVQDDEALRSYCEGVLGPIEQVDDRYGEELLRSLEVFIERNGQWERAARELYCHRHTLRYRMRRVEALTGRDLHSAQDRIELWLALRGRELVR